LTDERPLLERAARELGVALDNGQIDRLLRYVALVRDWNRRVNLVSRRDTDRLVSYHLVDSLAAARFVRPGARVADVGAGAGLPGIPLAIACPGSEFLLVESTRKKCRFMGSVLAALKLDNARVICARSEDLDPLNCRLVLSRVTGPRYPSFLRHCRSCPRGLTSPKKARRLRLSLPCSQVDATGLACPGFAQLLERR
jgi:16S rRNA (guanine(527)-N(7))-methyltransferase RsmG